MASVENSDEGTSAPLTNAERRRAIALIATTDAALAERISVELADDEDPMVRLLRQTLQAQTKMLSHEFDGLKKEMVSTRKSVVGIAVLTLLLMAAMVGIGVTYQTPAGTLTVTPTHTDVGPLQTAPSFGMADFELFQNASASTDKAAVAPVPGYESTQPEE